MRRYRMEPLGSEREVWCYDGRREVQGADCYTWIRFLPFKNDEGYTKLAIAMPVATFWPNS